MSKRFRQYFGILAAVISYYIMHEGAHLLVALYYGVFKGINFMGLGMQIDVYAERLTDTQLGLFCLAGPVATLLFGWMLILLAKRICTSKSKLFKAIMWYISLSFLIIDPLYMSVLCGFFGGGDMNGIKLLFPEIAVRIVSAVIGVIHGIVIWKYLLPSYTKSFQKDNICIGFGKKQDIERWMHLVSKVSSSFPGLENEEALEEHKRTVLEFMHHQEAVCARADKRIVGVLLFSRERNELCFLAVDPASRRRHIGEAMIQFMLPLMNPNKDITVTTYRDGIPEGIAARAFYQKLGFKPGRLTEGFGSPVQEFVLKR